jgi:hypothetical protein
VFFCHPLLSRINSIPDEETKIFTDPRHHHRIGKKEFEKEGSQINSEPAPTMSEYYLILYNLIKYVSQKFNQGIKRKLFPHWLPFLFGQKFTS